MIALPIGPRTQRLVTAAAPAYLQARGTPNTRATCCNTPACAASSPAAPFRCGSSNATAKSCASTRQARLQVRQGAAFDLAVQAAIDGLGIIHLFEDWYARISKAVPWCPCWNRGGKASAGRSCITPGGGICRRR